MIFRGGKSEKWCCRLLNPSTSYAGVADAEDASASGRGGEQILHGRVLLLAEILAVGAAVVGEGEEVEG